MARQPLLSVNRDRPALVRSTATARSPPTKGRCIRVKLACKMTRGPPRLHSPAFSRLSGVNSNTKGRLGTRRHACGCRRDICVCLIKTGFDRSVGGAVWALTADPEPPLRLRTRPNTSRQPALHRCGCVEAKPRRIQSPSLPPQRAVAALAPPLRHRDLCCREQRALLSR